SLVTRMDLASIADERWLWFENIQRMEGISPSVLARGVVGNEKFQSMAYCLEGKLIPWNFIWRKHLYFEGFNPGCIIEVMQSSAIKHVNLMNVRYVQQRKQFVYFNVGAGFLDSFSHGCFGSCFIVFHEARR